MLQVSRYVDVHKCIEVNSSQKWNSFYLKQFNNSSKYIIWFKKKTNLISVKLDKKTYDMGEQLKRSLKIDYIQNCCICARVCTCGCNMYKGK